MGDSLGESDVARLLKIPESTVRRFFEKGVLSGTQSGENWHTTEEILRGDIEILTDISRIDRLREHKIASPWSDALEEGDRGYISSEKIQAILAEKETAYKPY